MKPYYQDSAVTIYNCDCRDIIKDLGHFDLLLCDPPYGIGEHGGKCRTRGCSVPNHVNMGWDNATPSAELFSLLLSACDIQMIFGGNYFTDKLPVSRCWLYWRKLMGGDFADGELVWTNRDAVVKEFTKPNKGLQCQHPTQKPVEVMTWCISLAGDTAQTILDPFAGSCTTARAAKDLGRKCVCIEREERYCEIGAKRMAQEVFSL